MSCDTFGPLLLDDGPRTPEADAHLRSCPKCQALLEAQTSAQRLRGLVNWELPSRTQELKVSSLWRKRLLWRATFACLAAGVAIAAVLATPEAKTTAPIAAPAPSSVATRSAIMDGAQPNEDLRALMLEVDSYTHEEVGTGDPALAAFGALPDVLTPEDER